MSDSAERILKRTEWAFEEIWEKLVEANKDGIVTDYEMSRLISRMKNLMTEWEILP